MRNAKINEKEIFVANYEGVIPVIDSDGDETGEKKVVYSSPISFRANVSGARGSASIEAFGTDIAYDKTISISKSRFEELGITENSVFFIDKKPSCEDDNVLYDYDVQKIAETLNEVVIAVSKVRQTLK